MSYITIRCLILEKHIQENNITIVLITENIYYKNTDIKGLIFNCNHIGSIYYRDKYIEVTLLSQGHTC